MSEILPREDFFLSNTDAALFSARVCFSSTTLENMTRFRLNSMADLKAS